MTIPATTVPLIDRLRRATQGRFDIITTLGEGGMATVFLARDLTLDRQVAIKVMHPALLSSAAAFSRFRNEARVVASLDHPHIIGIFAVGEDPELAFYVMRFVEGRTLQQLIDDEGSLSVGRAVRILESIGQALHYAHRRGVIHRDVKPANVMVLDDDDFVLVTDFGLARLEESDHLTLTGHVVGTPRYMCPEYFEHGRISAASDQYALGVTAYELLTGTAPFSGTTMGELMRGHLLDAIPSVRTVRPELTAALDEVVGRMLAKDPATRFVTVADAIAGLRAAYVAGPASVEPTEIIRTPVSNGLRRPTSSGAWRVTRRRIGAAGIVAGVVLAVSLAIVASPSGIVPAPGGPDPIKSELVLVTDPARDAATERLTPPAPSPPRPTTGTVRVGSRLPLSALYVGDGAARLIGDQGIQSIVLPVGTVRLSIRLDGCAPWDTVVTVRGGETQTVGYRAPRC